MWSCSKAAWSGCGLLKLSEDAMARVKEVLGIVLAPNAVASPRAP
jgi:hypothetical protein